MAIQVFLKMLKMDCDPDAFKCSTLIQGYMNLCLLNRGWAIYKQMAESGVQSTVSTFGIMINKCSKDGKIDYGWMLLNNIVN